ncbi:MAG TPA: crossover junction endodeoxyribonuclease RuvC [Alphaproteobacteria bacterium]|nr:crossover junction endodeoxyribonuclease RuvC [Alphaproteobacteria bacterium]
MKLLGLDPGLRKTGWGIIEAADGRLRHVANGAVDSDDALAIPERLVQLYEGILAVIERYAPKQAAVEETFVNKNPSSTLKLGLARGVVLLAPARAGLKVTEYPTNLVKKAVVGAGHADKRQVETMVKHLLPTAEIAGPDAADALAVAICHAHHAATFERWHDYALTAGRAAS